VPTPRGAAGRRHCRADFIEHEVEQAVDATLAIGRKYVGGHGLELRGRQMGRQPRERMPLPSHRPIVLVDLAQLIGDGLQRRDPE
jgi:hypothetical protein